MIKRFWKPLMVLILMYVPIINFHYLDRGIDGKRLCLTVLQLGLQGLSRF